MATSSLQRKYRAPCPGCGAPVDFFSAQSTHAVCAYCQTTVLRSGEVLSRIGKMSEVFDDHSPLQLMASGQFKGQAFTVVGRLQYQYGQDETWTEWTCVRADGSAAFLSEDNGSYVLGTPLALALPRVPASAYPLGSPHTFNNTPYTVSSNRTVSLRSAQGELPSLPSLGAPFEMVELRSPSGEVLSIDYGPTLQGQAPQVSVGQSVALADLALKGLKDESVSEKGGRQLACPNCGGAVTVQLATSKSVTCGQCKSLIDLSQGLGVELKAAIQQESLQPTIPVGSTGQWQGSTWQVVGYQHRMGKDPSDPDESFGWEEYLLYNRTLGFQFLVDSQEGWSAVKPATGAPSGAPGSKFIKYLSKTYTLKYSYQATTQYVVGEFYWRVQRGQTTTNSDYQSGRSLLSAEQDGSEIIWSIGEAVSSESVAKAFNLSESPAFATRRDAPAAAALSAGSLSLKGWIILILVVFFVLFLISRCSNNCDPRYENCSSSRSGGYSGGSYGGFSTGGGHK